jgi:hypothetical protein
MELDPRDETYEAREEAAQEHLSQRATDTPPGATP